MKKLNFTFNEKWKLQNEFCSYLILELESKTKHGYLGRNAKIKLIVSNTHKKSRSLNDTASSYPKWICAQEMAYS